MLPRVVLVRTDVSEEHIASIIRGTTIGQLGTTLAVTTNRSTLRNSSILVTLMMEAYVLPKRRFLQESNDGHFYSHRCESQKSYICS
jgi:hypothetical protein